MPLDYLQIILMALTLILAISTVELKNLLYAVVSFCAMCISIGALYWLMNAPYVSVFQLLIYAGAIVTIFLAALTLTKMKGSVK
jgi:NADH:ubiquinone oxidoreductase subunit 6 (subunit J)